MTVQLKSIAVLAVVGLTVPGCTALFGSGRLANRSESQVQQQAAAVQTPAARPTLLTDAGRRALDQGNAGLAIEAFTRAVTSGEAPAPALNGLGVSYARIGRFDLAQRYFERAATLDPAEPRYQANLARLIRSPLFAKRHEADQTRALMAQAEQQQAQAEQTRQAAAPGQLRRLGGNQFFIQTVAPAPGKGPVRTAVVISRNKLRPAIEIKSVEAAFDATMGKAEAVPAPADDKPTPRTVRFAPAPTAKP